MSNVYFIGDLHLGHRNVTRFRTGFSSVEQHDEIIMENILRTVVKRDILYVLGDVAFTEDGLNRMFEIPCRKILVRGNHDAFPVSRYLAVFEDILGLAYYKNGYWLSHAPVHPAELRGRRNIHGHVHTNTVQKYHMGGPIDDERYINVSAENVGYVPRTLNELIAGRPNPFAT